MITNSVLGLENIFKTQITNSVLGLENNFVSMITDLDMISVYDIVFESSLTKSDFTFKTKTFIKFFPSLDRQNFFYGFRFQNYCVCDDKMGFFDNFLCEKH